MRLYADDPDAPASRSGVVEQHFPIRGNEIVPTIESREGARFVFHLRGSLPRRLAYTVEQGSAASNKIFFRQGSELRLLVSEKVKRKASREIRVPRETGDLEFVTRGMIDWLDLRVVRTVFLWPGYLAIGLGLFCLLLRAPRPRFRRGAEWLLLAISLLLCLGIAEWVMRAWGARLVPGILAARSEFGLVGEDSRLLDPKRYKIRLRPNLNAHYEWQIGDIARLNFIPKDVIPGVRHRYLIRTDAEGFRNDRRAGDD